jgi:glutamate dehydrogenase
MGQIGYPDIVSSLDQSLRRTIEKKYRIQTRRFLENLRWLYAHMHPYFFITMKDETDAIIQLAASLHKLSSQRQVILVEEDRKLILARLDIPGSIYETLKVLREREISYAEMSHSYQPIPGIGRELEVQRFEFGRVVNVAGLKEGIPVPPRIRRSILKAMRDHYPRFDFKDFRSSLSLLWVNNAAYVRISPPERIARVLWTYQQGRRHNGLYLDVEDKKDESGIEESRIMFSVGNPPLRGFLTQVGEILQRMNLGLRRSYSLIINTGLHPYFLGNFYVVRREGGLIEKDSHFFDRLKSELYNTQILSSTSTVYTDFVMNRVMTGEEASLTNSFIAFCHTILGHNQPDRFDATAVKDAFHADPEMALRLIKVFKNRFDPDLSDREDDYRQSLQESMECIENYNTGHRYLDEIRKVIYRTCLSFIRNTLKTNFFVPEKHALAFRLDPAFLTEMKTEFTSDLPHALPFRVTFFFTRFGLGYHIGFSDIARGGWRTIVCKDTDELLTCTYTLFREVYVLAHTQHLKNKDIYEGGSKLTIVLDGTGLDSQEAITERLYKVQYGILNAFLDIFVTKDGKVVNPTVVDYYGEEEPIELGPDENMHDSMIELIARQSLKRGYVLGIGLISSKRLGINHKEFGVTSRGVVKFAEIAMKEIGLDIYESPFSVRFTGGPNGDVAGNSMRLLMDRCPRMRILSIVDGTAGLFDPDGIDQTVLRGLILKMDLHRFDPGSLHPGGFMLYRQERRKTGLRELFRKVVKSASIVEEQWMTTDDFHREMENLTFKIRTDLFLPCGGRPETVDQTNWQKFFDGPDPTVSVIVEGANSFMTPEARNEIQKRGIIVLRDASANKCGVISSSYEIIANLLMSNKEFIVHKESYIRDVITILEMRARQEAELIFRRHRESDGKALYTEISDAISDEINRHYTALFDYIRSHPEVPSRPIFRRVLLNHLPLFIRVNPSYRRRVKRFPPKISYAILASEIASSVVYHGGWELDFESRLMSYLKGRFPDKKS